MIFVYEDWNDEKRTRWENSGKWEFVEIEENLKSENQFFKNEKKNLSHFSKNEL